MNLSQRRQTQRVSKISWKLSKDTETVLRQKFKQKTFFAVNVYSANFGLNY